MRVGAALHSLAKRVDRIVTSDALRARQTAELAASAAGYSGPVEEDPDIYYTSAEALTGVVKGLADGDDCVVLVGHNPSFEDLAGMLAAEGTPAVSLGTANVAVLAFDVRHWRDVRPGTGRLLRVYSPKDER
jgi:phosphohistidine phosphatase